MPEEIVMPRLSDTMEEGTIAQWLKREGDTVHKGEAILEVETDKANMELQAFSDGVIQKILRDNGATVPIGTAVGILARVGEEVAPAASDQAAAGASGGTAAAPSGEKNGAPLAPANAREAPAPATVAAPAQPAPGQNGALAAVGGRVKATPVARKVAGDLGIDLTALNGRGSGPGGRIVKDDVERFKTQQGAVLAPAPQPQQAPTPAAPQPAFAAAAAGAEVEMRKPNRIQAITARRLLESKTTVPHFYVTNEVDMTAATALRTQLQDTFGGEVKVTFNHLIVRACALALRAMPQVNTSWIDEQFAAHARVNVGIAVDLPDGGLVVPVIHDADRKTLREIATEARTLAEKARNGKLAPTDMQGGTFTVSNLGMFDVEEFQAIINPPESAILAVGSIVEKPVALDGQVVIRPRMRLSLSVDHRVIPGVPAAQFLQQVKRLLQEPLRLGF